MNDLEKREEYTPTNVLAKQGVAAIAEIAGGLILLIMNIFSMRLPPLGIALGLIVSGIGISGLISKDPEGKKPGTILTIAGVLKLVSHIGPAFIRSFAGFLLNVSCLGLLALGVVNGVRFLKGLKSRK